MRIAVVCGPICSHVLETVERVCDRVAIIKSPGQMVWEGEIASLAAGRGIVSGGQEFRTLEDLFLHVAGERYANLGWL